MGKGITMIKKMLQKDNLKKTAQLSVAGLLLGATAYAATFAVQPPTELSPSAVTTQVTESATITETDNAKIIKSANKKAEKDVDPASSYVVEKTIVEYKAEVETTKKATAVKTVKKKKVKRNASSINFYDEKVERRRDIYDNTYTSDKNIVEETTTEIVEETIAGPENSDIPNENEIEVPTTEEEVISASDYSYVTDVAPDVEP